MVSITRHVNVMVKPPQCPLSPVWVLNRPARLYTLRSSYPVYFLDCQNVVLKNTFEQSQKLTWTWKTIIIILETFYYLYGTVPLIRLLWKKTTENNHPEDANIKTMTKRSTKDETGHKYLHTRHPVM